MIRTLNIIPAEWEVLQRDGTAWIVRDGDCPHNVLPCGGDDCCCPHFTPAELVAAAAPCETCEWQPQWVTNPLGVDAPMVPCPACRIALVGECPTCRGRGRKWRGGAPCACEAPGCEWGTVTLGYAYADSEALPITHWGAQDRPGGPQLMFDVSMDGTPVIDYWDGKRTTEVTDDFAHYGELAALVGRYALKVRLA